MDAMILGDDGINLADREVIMGVNLTAADVREWQEAKPGSVLFVSNASLSMFRLPVDFDTTIWATIPAGAD